MIQGVFSRYVGSFTGYEQVWGTGGREFKSRHSDHLSPSKTREFSGKKVSLGSAKSLHGTATEPSEGSARNRPTDANSARLALCVCTFRRPQMLRGFVASIAKLARPIPAPSCGLVPADDIAFLCINLERSPDRRRRMEAAASDAGFEITFIPAIDGRQLSLEAVPDYDREGRLKHAPDLQINEIACVLSHKRALETFLASSARFAVVLEDDAIPGRGFMPFVQQAAALPIPWHAINLENRNRRQLRPAIARFGDIGLHASATLSSGAAAWLYSREGAALTLRSLASFRHAIDTHLGFFWRNKVTALCAYPPLVTQDHTAAPATGARVFCESDLSYAQFVRWRIERIEHSIRKRIAAALILIRLKLAIIRGRPC